MGSGKGFVLSLLWYPHQGNWGEKHCLCLRMRAQIRFWTCLVYLNPFLTQSSVSARYWVCSSPFTQRPQGKVQSWLWLTYCWSHSSCATQNRHLALFLRETSTTWSVNWRLCQVRKMWWAGGQCLDLLSFYNIQVEFCPAGLVGSASWRQKDQGGQVATECEITLTTLKLCVTGPISPCFLGWRA